MEKENEEIGNEALEQTTEVVEGKVSDYLELLRAESISASPDSKQLGPASTSVSPPQLTRAAPNDERPNTTSDEREAFKRKLLFQFVKEYKRLKDEKTKETTRVRRPLTKPAVPKVQTNLKRITKKPSEKSIELDPSVYLYSTD
jgi:hypothetical protein